MLLPLLVAKIPICSPSSSTLSLLDLSVSILWLCHDRDCECKLLIARRWIGNYHFACLSRSCGVLLFVCHHCFDFPSPYAITNFVETLEIS